MFLLNSQDIGAITRTLHAAQRLADLVGGRGVHVARKKAHVGHLQRVTTLVQLTARKQARSHHVAQAVDDVLHLEDACVGL
jgi:hypothetical protein